MYVLIYRAFGYQVLIMDQTALSAIVCLVHRGAILDLTSHPPVEHQHYLAGARQYWLIIWS